MLSKLWQDWQRNRQARKRNRIRTQSLLDALTQMPETQQASVLALATLFRHKVINHSQQLSDVIYHPEHSSPKKLRLVFELLEAIQTRMKTEMHNVQKHLHDIPLIANQSPEAHWLHSMQGMDLWLITLGAAMDPDQRANAVRIWNLLGASSHHLVFAIAALRELEQASSTQNEMYGDIKDEHWLSLCSYRPGALGLTDASLTRN